MTPGPVHHINVTLAEFDQIKRIEREHLLRPVGMRLEILRFLGLDPHDTGDDWKIRVVRTVDQRVTLDAAS